VLSGSLFLLNCPSHILETGKSPQYVYQSKPPFLKALRIPSCDPTLGNGHSQTESSRNSGHSEPDISCQYTKYQRVTDILNPLGLGVKVSFTILSIFDMARTIGL
jgi:hypothetical protein